MSDERFDFQFGFEGDLYEDIGGGGGGGGAGGNLGMGRYGHIQLDNDAFVIGIGGISSVSATEVSALEDLSTWPQQPMELAGVSTEHDPIIELLRFEEDIKAEQEKKKSEDTVPPQWWDAKNQYVVRAFQRPDAVLRVPVPSGYPLALQKLETKMYQVGGGPNGMGYAYNAQTGVQYPWTHIGVSLYALCACGNNIKLYWEFVERNAPALVQRYADEMRGRMSTARFLDIVTDTDWVVRIVQSVRSIMGHEQYSRYRPMFTLEFDTGALGQLEHRIVLRRRSPDYLDTWVNTQLSLALFWMHESLIADFNTNAANAHPFEFQVPEGASYNAMELLAGMFSQVEVANAPPDVLAAYEHIAFPGEPWFTVRFSSGSACVPQRKLSLQWGGGQVFFWSDKTVDTPERLKRLQKLHEAFIARFMGSPSNDVYANVLQWRLHCEYKTPSVNSLFKLSKEEQKTFGTSNRERLRVHLGGADVTDEAVSTEYPRILNWRSAEFFRLEVDGTRQPFRIGTDTGAAVIPSTNSPLTAEEREIDRTRYYVNYKINTNRHLLSSSSSSSSSSSTKTKSAVKGPLPPSQLTLFGSSQPR